jgi:uncharacterized protein YjcR
VPRKRDPKRDEAKAIWLKSNGSLKLVDLAKQMGVTPSTIRKWKAQDKWENELKGSAPIPKENAPKRSRGHPGGQPGNKNAKGHGPPKENQNAKTHGFFSKFLPVETLEIMESMNELSPADLIWDQIQIQYAAIIRAQKIMFVTSKTEMIKELKKSKYELLPDGENGFEQVTTEEEYELQFSWDRHATFLNAQSRAMSELRGLIKQFNELAFEDDERRLKLQQMSLNIDKTKAKLERVKNPENEDNEQWIASLKAVANKRRQLKGEQHE